MCDQCVTRLRLTVAPDAQQALVDALEQIKTEEMASAEEEPVALEEEPVDQCVDEAAALEEEVAEGDPGGAAASLENSAGPVSKKNNTTGVAGFGVGAFGGMKLEAEVRTGKRNY